MVPLIFGGFRFDRWQIGVIMDMTDELCGSGIVIGAHENFYTFFLIAVFCAPKVSEYPEVKGVDHGAVEFQSRRDGHGLVLLIQVSTVKSQGRRTFFSFRVVDFPRRGVSGFGGPLPGPAGGHSIDSVFEVFRIRYALRQAWRVAGNRCVQAGIVFRTDDSNADIVEGGICHVHVRRGEVGNHSGEVAEHFILLHGVNHRGAQVGLYQVGEHLDVVSARTARRVFSNKILY